MITNTVSRFALLTACLLALPFALPFAQSAAKSKSEYQSSNTRIKADCTSDKTARSSQTGNANYICIGDPQSSGVASAKMSFGKS